MKTREEEIIKAWKDLDYDEGYFSDFYEGTQWADNNPAPHVVALIAAVEHYVQDYDIGMVSLERALAAYHKATKGEES